MSEILTPFTHSYHMIVVSLQHEVYQRGAHVVSLAHRRDSMHHISTPIAAVVAKTNERLRHRRDAAEMSGLQELADQLTVQIVTLAKLTHPAQEAPK